MRRLARDLLDTYFLLDLALCEHDPYRVEVLMTQLDEQLAALATAAGLEKVT